PASLKKRQFVHLGGGDALEQAQRVLVKSSDGTSHPVRTIGRIDIFYWNRAAGLLALWGHAPAWIAMMHDGSAYFVLRDRRTVMYSPDADRQALQEASGPPSPDGLPRVL